MSISEIKCYICDGKFDIDPQYRQVKIQYLKRKKHFVAHSWKKKTLLCGLHCPYCGNILLDKILNEKKRMIKQGYEHFTKEQAPWQGQAKQTIMPLYQNIGTWPRPAFLQWFSFNRPPEWQHAQAVGGRY